MVLPFTGISRNTLGSEDSSAASAASESPSSVSQTSQSCSAGCRQEMASVTAMLQDLFLNLVLQPWLLHLIYQVTDGVVLGVDRLEALDLGTDDS